MILPGETEARSAGRNHAEGSPGDRIDALEIPARRAEYSLTESARSPFQAEPIHWFVCTPRELEGTSCVRSPPSREQWCKH
jgi:hypothetical protein